MVCKDFFDLLDNYESLNENQHNELELHAQSCENCRNELEFFKSIILTSASIPCPPPPKTLISDINERLDNEPVLSGFAKFKNTIRDNSKSLATVAACLVLGLTVGLNSGYIKDSLQGDNSDGVINETTHNNSGEVKPENTEETVISENKSNKAGNNGTKESAKKQKENSEKKAEVGSATVKPTKTATQEPKAETKATAKPVKPTAKPVVGTQTTQSPENTPVTEPIKELPTVDDYLLADGEAQVAYQSENVKKRRTVESTMSDYLIVECDDSNAIESTLNEIGVKNGEGYYMTSRENFYELMDRLNTQGVKYSCDLNYSSGERIAFKLIYN